MGGTVEFEVAVKFVRTLVCTEVASEQSHCKETTGRAMIIEKFILF